MSRNVIRATSLAAAISLSISAAALAASFPDNPLQVGVKPPPNIMFILDDSGSMGWLTMPHNVGGELASTSIRDRSSSHNTLYYDPVTLYEPWKTAAGTSMTGGTDFESVYGDFDTAGGSTIDLSNSGSCRTYVQNGSNVQVCGGPAQATYYVLIAGNTANANDPARYNRYQIIRVNSQLRVVRSTWSRNGAVNADLGCVNPGQNTFGWRGCTFATPTGRDEAEEIRNFATWFSYHRSRMKVAKAGASEVFAGLGTGYRVGYDTIWNRSQLEIPVNSTAGGRFEGSSRTDFFSRLQAAETSGNTPLKGALQRAGQYYSRADAAGPWGPGTGQAQLTCRQNFALLTTDGYWNANNGYTQPVGNADGIAGPQITGTRDRSYQYVPKRPYMDNASGGYSDTLADIAMHYWNRDLRPDLENNIPSKDNEGFWQNMVTFGISIGLKGNLNPATDLDALKNGSKEWPNPNDAEDADRIDDLWHASVNGRGEFVAASNTKEFAAGLQRALNTIDAILASGSNVTSNSTSYVDDTRVYQATFYSGKWTGEVSAYDATSAGVSPTAAWNASAGIPAAGRNIFTAETATRGANFPTAAQIAGLARTAAPSPVSGADNAAYIAGNRSKENAAGKLRVREHLFGDVVNSSPMYVKDTNSLYVGANDGMLHAIDAADGTELFAYVPRGLDLADLASLSDPDYTHKYFVDGPVIVSTRKQTPGKNYLVGALGRGGKGVFGLDVTAPASFATRDVLWDRTGETDADMGHVLGEPLIAKTNSGDHVAIVPNGIDSTRGSSVLFVYDLSRGTVLAKIDTGAVGANGLSAPRGWDQDADGDVDFVYAGDLKGNVWKFDLRATNAGGWRVGLSGSPLFVATDSSSKRQPITSAVGLAREPLYGRMWVTVGTGKYISDDDVGDASQQTVYGLIDADTPIGNRSALQPRQIAVTGTVEGRAARAFEDNAPLPTGKNGWYIDLGIPKVGERVISNPRIRGRVLLFSSVIPNVTNPCDAQGEGYINALDMFTGTSLANNGTSVSFFDLGVVGDPADDKVGGKPVGSLGSGGGMPTMPIVIDRSVIYGTSSGAIGSKPTNEFGGQARRLSWRELYRD